MAGTTVIDITSLSDAVSNLSDLGIDIELEMQNETLDGFLMA
jgi:hypothetical protein